MLPKERELSELERKYKLLQEEIRKEKEPKSSKDKIKDQKQRMQEFSAQFDFGIA